MLLAAITLSSAYLRSESARDFIVSSKRKRCGEFCMKYAADMQTKCKSQNVFVLLEPLFKECI